MIRVILTFVVVAASPVAASAQAHFTDCADLTGGNATILLPSDAVVTLDGAPLSQGSEIAAFTQDGLCAGVSVWTGQATGLVIWGDDSQTAVKDGFAPGESLTYRVWDASAGIAYDETQRAFAAELSDAESFYATENAYEDNAIMEVRSLAGTAQGAPGSTMLSMPEGSFALHPNYPNPFNPSTTIRYDLPDARRVRLAVYNAAGALVEVLQDEIVRPGSHTVPWEAISAPSGTYFCRIQAGSETKVRPLVLLK